MLPLVAARGATQIGSAVVAVVVARSAGPERFGVFSGVLAVASIVVGGSCSGLPVFAIRRVASGDAPRNFARILCAKALRIGAVTSVIAIAVDLKLFGFRNAVTFGPLSAAVFVALAVLTTVSAIRSAEDQYMSSAFGEFAGSVMTVALALFGLLIGMGVTGALIGMVFGPLIGASIIARGIGRGSEDRRVQQERLQFREVVPFIALGFAGTGYIRMDSIILGFVTTPFVLGEYAAAYRILGIFTLLGSSFGTVFFSRLAANPQDASALRQATWMFLLLLMIPAVVIFVFASDLVTLIYGVSYAGSALPLRLLLFAMIPYGLYWPTAHYLNASGQERRLAAALGASTVVDVVLVAFLSPRFGAAGAAAAWVAAESITLFICGLLLWRLMTSLAATRTESSFDPP